MGRHSGLQLRVLALYRQALRTARSKAQPERAALEAHVREEFRRQVCMPSQCACVEHGSLGRVTVAAQARDVTRSEFQRIEYLLRRGQKQVKTMQSSRGIAYLQVERDAER